MQQLAELVNSILSGSDSLLAISRTGAAALLTNIWQGALVSACLGMSLRFTPQTTATHRFAVWAAGFLVLISLPFTPTIFHLVDWFAGNPTLGLASTTALAPRPWFHIDIRWSLAIVALWAVVSLYRAVDLGVHSLRLHRLWKSATAIDLDSLFPSVASLLRERAEKTVRLCITTELDRPSVIGFFVPRILIPAWLLPKLTEGELEQIVLHETEHLRRGDDWTNLFQKLALVFFPLNPFLLWIERRLCLEREMACDDGVVRITQAPRAYAACLTSLAERGLQRRADALSLGAWHSRPELVHRVHSILVRKQVLGPLGTRALFAVLGCGLVFGSVELSRCPQLVAFVPTAVANPSSLNSAVAVKIPHTCVTPGIQLASTKVPLRNAAQPRLMQLKSVMPADHPAQRERIRVTEACLHSRHIKAGAAYAVSQRGLVHTSSRGQVSGRQWVVLTTWEQQRPVSDSPEQVTVQTTDQLAEPGTAEQADQVIDSATQSITSRMIVTRLVFRILPTTSFSPEPTMLVRNGWLLIQL
jgi:beta-lactamase regulating signal transducer with metallopeptidase domain